MAAIRSNILRRGGGGLGLACLLLAMACSGEAPAPAPAEGEKKEGAAPPGQRIYLDAQGNPTTPPAGASIQAARKADPQVRRTVTLPDGTTRTAISGPKAALSAAVGPDGQIKFSCDQFACSDPAHDHSARDAKAAAGKDEQQ